MDKNEQLNVQEMTAGNLPESVMDFINTKGPEFDEGGWWIEGAMDMYKWIISGGTYNPEK